MAKQVKTIKEKITSHTNTFEPTVRIYNEALSYFIEIVDKEFTDLSLYTTKSLVTLIERLTHATKMNPSPKYTDFDSQFYKFPSYFRRAAIASAVGKVNSRRSLLVNWQEERNLVLASGKRFNKKPPTFENQHNEFPVFYKGNMFKDNIDRSAKIKLYLNNDWVWVTININPSKNTLVDWKAGSPKLIKVGRKYFLATPYEKNIKLNKIKIEDQVIISVDLGLNKSAVCSAIRSDGTIVGRLFINQPKEKDRMDRILKKVSQANRTYGGTEKPNLWRRINGLQKHIITDTSRQIVIFALECGASTIVFEYLGNMRIAKGTYGANRNKQRLHHWAKIGVQNKTLEMAHYQGIRISRINPAYTSQLAFDGSGLVKRSKRKDLATFATGKIYHADLNASYNIGARYFIRELLKTFSEKKKSALEAKVPHLAARTQQSLSTLTSFHQALMPTA